MQAAVADRMGGYGAFFLLSFAHLGWRYGSLYWPALGLYKDCDGVYGLWMRCV